MSLRWRFSLALLCSAVLILGGLLLTLDHSLREMKARSGQEWRTRQADEVRLRLDRMASMTVASVEDLASSSALRRFLEEAEEQGGSERRDLRLWASEYAPRFELDHLLILSPEGRVLSQAPKPQAQGVMHPQYAMLREQAHTKVLAWKSWTADDSGDASWWVGAAREVSFEDRAYLVVGASALSASRLTEIASRSGAKSLSLGLALKPLISVQLPAGWRIQGELPLALDPGEPPSLPVLQSMRTRLFRLSLMSFLIVLVLTPLLAHGLVRPLDVLRRAVHRMESGEREIEFAVGGPTEVKELANALRDLSQSLQSSEARMRSAERRAAWREMARRVAHEIKNALSPLTLAMDNVETAARRDDPAARRALVSSLQTAREQLQSLDRLVSEFRDFARTPRLAFQPTQALSLAELALASVREQYPKLEFRIVERATVGVVSVDPEQMRRVMQNLLANAAQAAPHAPIELALGTGPGNDRWWFAVLDRGPGLPEEIASHWGEPYHTTKEGGTGLGLSIARQVVEGHQGVLSARARSGGGLEIHADLPREASLAREEDT